MGKYYNESNPEMENVTDQSYAEMGERLTGAVTESNLEAGEDVTLGEMPLEKKLSHVANLEAGTDMTTAEGMSDIANLEAGTDVSCESCSVCSDCEVGEEADCADSDMDEGAACGNCSGCFGCEAGEDLTAEEGVTENAPYHNIAKYKMVTSAFVEDSEGVDTQKS